MSKFNLTSLGFVQNLSVVGWLGEVELGAQTVDLATPNQVEFTFTVPENGAAKTPDSRLAFLASESGAVVSLPVVVPPLVEPTATPEPTVTVEPTATATATAAPVPTATTPAADGGALATTGADDNAIFAAIAGALALLVAGGAAMLLRRRAGSDA